MSAVRLAAIPLGRSAQDLAAWTSFEMGQLRVPGSLVQVSSIMPQKRNPVPVEHLRHLFSTAAGRADAVVRTVHDTSHADMNDGEGEVQAQAHGALEIAGRAVDLMAALVPACVVDAARVRRTLDAARATIAELADTLVREEGLGFRQAHDVAARTGRAVIAREAPLSEGWGAFAAAFEAVAGRATSLTEAAFAEAASAEGFVARRDRPGGPAPAALLLALDRYDGEARAVRPARGLDEPARRRRRAARGGLRRAEGGVRWLGSRSTGSR